MCNEYQLRKFRPEISERFAQIRIPVTWADAGGNRPADRPFRPTDRAPILRPADPANPSLGLIGSDVRWWLIPFFHKGAVKDWKAMCTNARLETLDTTAAFRDAYRRRRCLVPVTSFIEYDTPPGWKKGDPKRRWEIGWGDEIRYFAGLWDHAFPSDMAEGVESFAFVTGEPGPDFATPREDTGKPLHTRQARVLTLREGMEWLRLDGPGKALLDDPGATRCFSVTEAPRAAEAA